MTLLEEEPVLANSFLVLLQLFQVSYFPLLISSIVALIL